MKINTGVSALQNLIALILADNEGTALTEAQFTAGAPAVIAGEEGRNTSVTLTAVEGEGYAGSVTFNYTRLDLNSGVAVPVTSVQIAEGDDLAAATAAVVAAMGLVADEVTASDFEAPVGETAGSIVITAVAGSLLYTGEPVIIELTVPAPATPDMSETFAVTDLNGFVAETGE